MADNQIVLSFVGKDGGVITVSKNVASAIDNVGKSAKTAKKSIEDLGTGWAKLNQQQTAKSAALEWTNKLASATSGATQAIREGAAIQVKAADAAAEAVTNSNKRMELSFRSMLPHIRTAGAAIGVYFGTKAVASIIETADAYTDLTARLKLVSGTSEELSTAQNKLFEVAQKNRVPISETVTLYFRLADSMRTLGASQKDTIGLVETIGQAMRISGTNTVETAAAMLQLSQAFQKNKLDGDEFKSVMENAPRIVRALTDEFNINKVTLYDWSSNGKLTVDKLVQALQNQAGKIADEFRQIPTTISGAWTQLSNAMVKYIGDADQSTKSSQNLAVEISKLALNLNTVMDPFATFVTGVVGGFNMILDKAKEINAEFKDAFGIQRMQKFDDETAKLMKWGSGQASIAEVAGPPKSDQSQQPYFDGIQRTTAAMKTEAEMAKELRTQLETLNASTQKQVEGYKKGVSAYKEEKDTVLKALDNQIKAQEDIAKLDMDAAHTADEKMRISKEYQTWLKDQLQAEFSHKSDILEVEKLSQNSIIDLYKKQISEGEKLKMTEADKLGIQSKIADAQTELNRLNEQSKQLDLDKSEALRKADQDSLQAQLKQQEFIRKINEELAYQTQLYEKLAAAKAAGASQKDLELQKSQFDRSRNIAESVPGANVEQLNATIQKTETLKQKTSELVNVEQAVKDEQLRMNQAIQETVQQAQLAAEAFKKAFGSFGDAIGSSLVSIAQFGQQLYQTQRDADNLMQKLDEKGQLTDTKKYEIQQKVADKSMRYQLGLFGDLTSASSKFFKEGSKGYAAMQNASKVFYAFRMAMEAKAAIQELQDIFKVTGAFVAGEETKTVVSAESTGAYVAEENIKGMAAAKTSIAAQGEIPIVGFALAAAMAAVMAAIGLFSGSVSAKGVSVADVQKQQDDAFAKNTATALGSTASSDSVSKSLSILAANSTNDLDYTKGMAKNMELLVGSINSLTTQIAKSFNFDVSKLNLGTTSSDRLKHIGLPTDPLMTALVHGIIGGTKISRELIDQGVAVVKQTFGQILESGVVKAQQYANILVTKTDKALFGMFKSTSQTIERNTSKLDPVIKNALGQVFDNAYATLVDAGKFLGKAGVEFENSLKQITIKKQDLKLGKDATKNAEKISAWISAQMDKAAEIAFPDMKQFQRVGEGMYETTIRVADGVAQAAQELQMLGLKAINYTQIISDQKDQIDIGAEITRQTILAQGDLSDGTREYVKQLKGSSKDISDAYKQILSINNLMRMSGFGATNIDQTMINAAGGLTAFEKALQTYTDSFMSPGALLSAESSQLADAFKGLGQAIPATRDEFTALVRSIDLTTDSGKTLFAQLMTLVPAFDAVQSKIDDIKKKYQDIIDPMGQYLDKLKSIDDDFKALLNAEVDRIKKSAKDGQDIYEQLVDAQNRIMQQKGAVMISTLEQIWKQITDGVNNLQKSLASQIATLQGPGATASLAGQNLGAAWGAVDSYMTSVKSGGSRNVSTEVNLLSNLQSAIMDRYNSEMALIQQAAQEQAQALQDGLQAQVDAINAATQAQIDAKTKENEAVLKGLQDQLDAANKLKTAIKQIQDYAKSMILGSNSPLSPERKLQASQSQYNELLRKAQSGDAEAMAQLTSASDTYLQAAKDYYGSGTQYSNIFDGVQSAMESLGAMDAPDPDSIQSHIDALKESQQAELEQIRKAAQDQISVLQKDVAQQIKDLSDPAKNSAMLALKEATIAELQKVQDLARLTQEEANRQAKEAYDLAKKEYEFSFAQTQYLRAIAENMHITELAPIPSHAKGGLASGLALVGEKGPELVNFSRPAQVMTAEETRRALSGDEETKTTLAAMLVEMKALVTTQSAANPQMVEKLSNMEARLSKMERNSRLIPA